MGLREFVTDHVFGPPDEVHFFERIGGKVVEVDRQGKPIVPVEGASGEVRVVTEEEYHTMRNSQRGTINKFIPTRTSDGHISLEPNTGRKNIDSIKPAR